MKKIGKITKVMKIDIISGLENLVRNRYVKQVVSEARSRLQRFRNLKAIDTETKHRLFPSVNHHEVQISATRCEVKTVRSALQTIYLIGSMLVFFGAPLWIGSLFDLPLQDIGQILILNMFGMLIFMFVLLVIPIVLAPRVFKTSWLTLVLLGSIAVLSLLVKSSLSTPPDLLSCLVMSVLSGQSGFLLILFITSALSSLIRTALYRRQESNHPDAVIVDNLIRILSNVEKNPHRWAYVPFRRAIVNDLEETASCVENSLRRRLKSGDVATDVWFEETTRKIAVALRAKKMWVLTPKTDSRVCFIESIAGTLIAAASGDWDAIEKAEPERVHVRQLWRERIVRTLRVVAVGGIPLGALWGIQLSPLVLQSPVKDYAAVGAILWAAFTVVAALDPSLKIRLDLFRDVVSLLPFGGKKT